MTIAIYPQKSHAGGFDGQVFLAWAVDQQKAYLETQLVMAGSIAARVNSSLSQCLSDHFFEPTGGISPAGFDEIMGNIAHFPTHHPSSVLVVTMEAACGAF